MSTEPAKTVEIEERIGALERQMAEVLARNRRVEMNKAWETSRTRLGCVTFVTYVTMVLVFAVLGSQKPLRDALVPTAGFFLSTLSLPFVRKLWEKGRN